MLEQEHLTLLDVLVVDDSRNDFHISVRQFFPDSLAKEFGIAAETRTA
jgi:hypothetical protein